MKLLVLACILAVAVSSSFKGTDEQDFAKFKAFMTKFEKSYSTVEEMDRRFLAFQKNLEIIDLRNKENVRAGGDEAHGITQFSDLTQEEFKNTYLMKPGFYKPRDHSNEVYVAPKAPQAGILDWRNTPNVVTPVKNQMQCGSCWAFSATEAIESFVTLAGLYYKNTTVELSTEQACSCTYKYNGCEGGNPQNVYTTAVDHYGGEESSAEYGYTMNCASCNVKSTSQKYADVSSTKYTNAAKGSLQTVLEDHGPPSVCVAAESWNSYTGGVLASCPGSVDHCVQAVGYNNGVANSYWIVRNSWGTSWGEKGYIYLAMSGDTCQIQDDINYPTPIAVPN
jgi:C1A family cysteine protease